MMRRFRWWIANKLLALAVVVAGTEEDGNGQDWYWSEVR